MMAGRFELDSAGAPSISRTCYLAVRSFTHPPSDQRFRIGRGILLGLEPLVAGDIIRSVAMASTFTSVEVLVLIVAIRTFLSFSLEVELSGRWPWQGRIDAPSSP
jgi:uncharacterized membrane protein